MSLPRGLLGRVGPGRWVYLCKTVNNQAHPILLFDGVCNLCNGLVKFVLRRDPAGLFRFATLQSGAGRGILERFGRSDRALNTFLLVNGDRCLDKSTAGLTTLKMLGWPWKAFYIFILVPAPIRDAIYDRIARNRYRIFGKREACMVPTPGVAARFLR